MGFEDEGAFVEMCTHEGSKVVGTGRLVKHTMVADCNTRATLVPGSSSEELQWAQPGDVHWTGATVEGYSGHSLETCTGGQLQ